MSPDPAPVEGFAAFFDILGFKELRSQLGTAGLFQRYQRGFAPAIAHSAAGRGKSVRQGDQTVWVPDPNSSSAGHLAVSDSILFWRSGSEYQDFASIMRAVQELVSFSWPMRLPLRGAIAFGDLIAQPPTLVLGTAVEEAVAWESRQAWSGTVLTPSCQELVVQRGYYDLWRHNAEAAASAAETDAAKLSFLRAARTLIEYDVPIKARGRQGELEYGSQRMFVHDWTVGALPTYAATALPESDDQHAQRIRRNTLDFEGWARSQHPELEAN